MHQHLEGALGDLADPYLNAKTFGQLGKVAFEYLEENHPLGIGMVIGTPGSRAAAVADRISSIYILGDKDTMNATVRNLRIEQKPVFDFEKVFIPRLYELWDEWMAFDPKSHVHEFCVPLLDDFYVPIAESRFISTAYYIDGTQGQQGTATLIAALERQKLWPLPRNYHLMAPALET